MTEFIITRGLPASGKTTWAKKWVAHSYQPDSGLNSRARVNKDDIRKMLHDSHFEKGVTEKQVNAARDAAITALLKSGVSVVNDDTNLPQRTAREMKKIADRTGAIFTVVDFTDVDLDVCIERDKIRWAESPVGEEVIREMHQRFIKGKKLPLPLPEEPEGDKTLWAPVVFNPFLREAIIVDIDGTVAIKGDRDIYDDSLLHLDTPNRPVVELVQRYAYNGMNVVFCSGRGDGCREATEAWLRKHVLDGAYFELHMRRQEDNRKDSQVKYELFDEFIRPKYNISFVLDDRNQVVEMWRAIGLTVLQVAPGDF